MDTKNDVATEPVDVAKDDATTRQPVAENEVEQTQPSTGEVATQKKVKQQSVAKGIIGGVVGAVAAFVVWMLGAFFIQGTISIMGGFLMGAFVYFGYRAFGGKQGRCLKTCVIIITLVCTFVGTVAYLVLDQYTYMIAYYESSMYMPFTEVLAMSGMTLDLFIADSLPSVFDATIQNLFALSLMSTVLTFVAAVGSFIVFFAREKRIMKQSAQICEASAVKDDAGVLGDDDAQTSGVDAQTSGEDAQTSDTGTDKEDAQTSDADDNSSDESSDDSSDDSDDK